MDNCLGTKCIEHSLNSSVVPQISNEHFHAQAGHFAPVRDTILQSANGNQGLHVQLKLPAPLCEIIQDRDRMSPARQIHGCRPTKIPVTAQNENSHLSS